MRAITYVALPVALLVSILHARPDEPTLPPTVAAGAKLEVAYDETETTKRFFEGPSFDPKTDALYFTAFGKDNSQILRLDAAGKVSVFLDKTEGINGTFLSRRGGLVGCQGNAKRVVRIPIGSDGRAGELQVLAENFEGTPFTAPNDLVEDSKGGIYFTDPDFNAKKTSAVYYITPSGTVERAVGDMQVPNGVYIAKGGLQIYVSDSEAKHVRAYPINPISGAVDQSNGRVFFDYQNVANTNPPDGMTLDERGNAYFTGRGGVWCVDAGGKALGFIAIPEFVSNCTFGGRDGRTLFMTCQNRLYKLAMTVRGREFAARHAFTGDEPIKWKTIVLDKTFRSEGVAVADVNKDGRLDIIASDVWYEAPDAKSFDDPAAWKMHEIRTAPPQPYDGTKGYSRGFGSWTDDWNGDGYPDVIVIPFPGEAAHWYENPKGKHTDADGKPIHWKEHLLWPSACNETPTYKPLLAEPASLARRSAKQLIMGWQPEGKDNEGFMAYFTPPKSGEGKWDAHSIGGPKAAYTQRFAHGLGIGDVNGDGRNDVITPAGWWEQPADPATADGNWPFHAAQLNGGEAGAVADMFAYDVNGDGVNDIISSSAHRFGLWWFEQIRFPARRDESQWKQHLIDDSFSQTHALQLVDLSGDGVKDIITGSRYYAHQGHDPGEQDPIVLYWYEIKRPTQKGGEVQFVRHLIAFDVGIGTQFVVEDINGDKRPDIIVANKRGVFVLVQEPKR